jgi:hypothetical protein
MKNKLIYIIGSSMVAGSLLFGGSALAAEKQNVPPAIFGSVTAVNDSTITVSGKSGKRGVTTTYTLDATGATITEGLGVGATALSLNNVAVGDSVAVLGQ